MHPLAVMAILVPWNTLVYGFIAKAWIAPRLARLPRHDALVPPLLLHLVRPISFWTTQGGRIPGMTIPIEWAMSTAIGDLVVAVLSLAAILALRARARGAIALAWIANVVGLVDAMKNGIYGARIGLAEHVGVAGLIMTYAVPALYVSHVLVFWLLLRKTASAEGS
jgi:hypothetical protein